MLTRTYYVNTTTSSTEEGSVVPRVWASAYCKSLQQKLPKGKERNNALLNVGRKYHLVTPST